MEIVHGGRGKAQPPQIVQVDSLVDCGVRIKKANIEKVRFCPVQKQAYATNKIWEPL
jgi:hypothetical protein